jgi:hypothetical protein
VTAQPSIETARCNIGPEEVARRRRGAIVATIVTIALAALLVAVGAPRVDRLVLWPFASAAGVTWLQVIHRFCVRFGAFGVENYGPLGAHVPVDPAVRAADRRQATRLILEGSFVGLLATLALVLLPA